MGFFSHLFHSTTAEEKGDIILYAPVNGTLIPLSEVPDIVISERVIGDGIAIYPEDDTILAPCAGTISRIIASKSAFAIKEEHGIEIYVSFGIHAYELAGEGFTSLVNIGDKVEVGSPILKVDRLSVANKIKSVLSSVIVVNNKDKILKVTAASGKCQASKTPISWILLKDEQKDLEEKA